MELLKLVCLRLVGKGQRGFIFSYTYPLFVKENIACPYANTSANTKTRVCLEWEIKHEVDVGAPVEPLDMDTVRGLGPIVIPQLEHEMVVGAPAQCHLAPVLFCRAGSRWC